MMKKLKENLVYILLVVLPPIGILLTCFAPEEKISKKSKVKLISMAAVWFFCILMLIMQLRENFEKQQSIFSNNVIDTSQSTSHFDKNSNSEVQEEEEPENDDNQKSENETAESNAEETNNEVPAEEGYDELQRIFMQLTLDTTHEEFLDMIKDTKLYRRERTPESCNYDSYEYILAKEDGAAKFAMADPGDKILVSFRVSDSDKLRYAVYRKKDSKRYGLIYSYGIFGYFTETNAADYAGYYTVHKYFTDKDDTADSLVIEYTDMPSWDSGYYPKDCAKTLVDETVAGVSEWMEE